MADPNRRLFLKHTAALTGALALGPFDPWTVSALGQIAAGGGQSAANDSLDLAIARWRADALLGADLRAVARMLTERAIAELGGMGRFVSKGDIVWVKPNIGWNRAPELAANTNPDVVATLVELCLKAGAKRVNVGDHSCHRAQQTYRTSGIAEAAAAAGAELVYLDEKRYREVALGGERLSSWPLYPEIIEADLLIDVPVVKHHGLSRATLCMKNLMGVIGGQRGSWHQALPECLCDVTAYLKPRLCVLDAVRVLTANGPQGGNPADVKTLGTVAAGVDIVAMDGLGAELLGHEPADIATVRAGHAAGLGQMDYRLLAHREITLS